MGAIEGYSFSYGLFSFQYKDMIHPEIYVPTVFLDSINIKELPIPENAMVTLSVSALYIQAATNNPLIYIDEITLPLQALLTFGTWTISPNAVMAQLDASTVPFDHAILQVPNNLDIDNLTGLTFLTTKDSLVLGLSGQKDATGYFTTQSFPISADAKISFDTDIIDTASKLRLPDICQTTIIESQNRNAMYIDPNVINELVISAGSYTLYCDQRSPMNGFERSTSWSIDELEVNGDRKLRMEQPELILQSFDVSADHIMTNVKIRQGDFQLTGMYDTYSIERIDITVKITNSKNEIVYEGDVDSSCCFYHSFDPELPSDTYIFEYTVTYPDLAEPLQMKKPFHIHKPFADISDTHWAHDAIEQLAARQIVKGVSQDEFAPNRRITRAEFTAMIVNALGLTSLQPAEFNDVPRSAWYADAVSAAFENNLVKGISRDEFAPNKSISREEMAVIIVNVLRLKQVSLQTTAQPISFNDSGMISAWASEAINIASANGIVNGDGKGGFNPRGMTTRAEAAQVLMKLINLVEQ
jgi:hypothetical protein